GWLRLPKIRSSWSRRDCSDSDERSCSSCALCTRRASSSAAIRSASLATTFSEPVAFPDSLESMAPLTSDNDTREGCWPKALELVRQTTIQLAERASNQLKIFMTFLRERCDREKKEAKRGR